MTERDDIIDNNEYTQVLNLKDEIERIAVLKTQILQDNIFDTITDDSDNNAVDYSNNIVAASILKETFDAIEEQISDIK